MVFCTFLFRRLLFIVYCFVCLVCRYSQLPNFTSPLGVGEHNTKIVAIDNNRYSPKENFAKTFPN